jgi:EmrB/QacA subfamily drug resistance transporter
MKTSDNTTPAGTAHGVERRRSGPLVTERRAVAIVYGAGMFMSIMDTQIVNVALATISRDFRAPTSSVQWIIVGYLLSLAVFIPASGWIGDRFGTKRTFLCAVALFTVASGLCAASGNLFELVATRVLQGAGGGMMVPVGTAMLYRAYPPAERVNVARMITRVMVLAPATAPIIGGVLVTQLSWHWIFLVNIPVGIIVFMFGLSFLAEHREERTPGFDLAGFAFGGPGLALVLYAVSEGPLTGWGSPRVIGTGLAGIVLLWAFGRAELRSEHPVLQLRLLSDNRLFRRCCALFACSSPAFFGSLVFVALYLQEGRGYSALVSGLTTFPEAVAIGLSSQVVAKLYPRVGPRRLITGGFVGLAVVAVLFSFVGASTSLWVIRALVFSIGLSVSYIMLPVQAAAFSQISSEQTGHASAIFNTFQRTAAAVGVAILSIVLALGTHHATRPPISAFHAVYLTAAAFAAIGALLALGVHDADAAATMVRHVRAPKTPGVPGPGPTPPRGDGASRRTARRPHGAPVTGA